MELSIRRTLNEGHNVLQPPVSSEPKQIMFGYRSVYEMCQKSGPAYFLPRCPQNQHSPVPSFISFDSTGDCCDVKLLLATWVVSTPYFRKARLVGVVKHRLNLTMSLRIGVKIVVEFILESQYISRGSPWLPSSRRKLCIDGQSEWWPTSDLEGCKVPDARATRANEDAGPCTG